MKKPLGWSEDLGSKLKVLRLDQKVKQIDLARSLGISPAYLNLIENNKRPMHVDVLEKLLTFFQIDMNVFMAASEGVKLHNRMEQILKDPFLQGHSLDASDLELLGKNSSVSNLIFSLHEGLKTSREQLHRMQQRMFSEEERNESEGASQDEDYILDRTAFDEVTDFLEHHKNYFPDLEDAAEEMLKAAGLEDVRSVRDLAEIIQKRWGIEVIARDFPPRTNILRLYNEKTRRLYVSNFFGVHRLHFQLANFIGLMMFKDENMIDGLIEGFTFRRAEAAELARVNLANYFAGAMLLPYKQFFDLVQSTDYDIRALEGRLGMPFEPIAHRVCTLSRPGMSGIPLHFIRTDLAGNIRKKYAGSGIKIDDRRRSCPKWAVHTAFLTPGILRRHYSVMPDGEVYFCAALAEVQHTREAFQVRHAISVGIGCRAEDAHFMAYSRGLRLENPERDAVKVGITCRLCDRPDCTQRALPSFKMDYEINTMNRKANVLAQIKPEDLLLIAEEAPPAQAPPAPGKGTVKNGRASKAAANKPGRAAKAAKARRKGKK